MTEATATAVMAGFFLVMFAISHVPAETQILIFIAWFGVLLLGEKERQ
jgi:hypothetical protein